MPALRKGKSLSILATLIVLFLLLPFALGLASVVEGIEVPTEDAEDITAITASALGLSEEESPSIDSSNADEAAQPPSEEGAAPESIIAQLAAGIMPLAAGTSSDLADFVTSVSMYDMSTTPPTLVDSQTPTYIGQTYKFEIDFAETSQLQMEYDASGVLTYQLPTNLNVQNAVLQTPLYGPGPNYAIIGWHTIDTYGVVQMWFNNVDLNGNPTPGNVNFIDYYANVEVTLDIYAQLMSSNDGDIDFGNGIIVGIVPPVDPPPSLSMHKSSRYEPSTERIYYMITITALGGSVTDITLTDNPTVSAGQGTTDFIDSPTSAFVGFRYDIDGDSAFEEPMTVTWTTSPLEFSYDFTGLTLAQNEFITVRYYLDIQTLITNNDGAGEALDGMSTTLYNFTINNLATVTGTDPSTGLPVPPVSDTTTDHVNKELVLTKNGTYFSGDNRIQWSIVVGDGVSIQLNGGIITDTLQNNLTLPADDQIIVQFYDSSGNQTFDSTAADPLFAGLYLRMANDSGFTLTLPALVVPFTPIYKVVITYSTTVDAPQQGMPPTIYGNDLTFSLPDGEGDFGTEGQVPVQADPVTVTKTTSGICGNPDAAALPTGQHYWVNYEITIDVPAGLQGQPLYLYDTLAIMPNGTSVANVPANFTITAVGAEVSTTALEYTDPVVSGNVWEVFFGMSGSSAPDPVTGIWGWQYNEEVTLTIDYRIYLDDATVTLLADKTTARQLQNAIHLINSTGAPNLGAVGNSVGSSSVTDSWPIFKRYSTTSNPSLFDYTVTINGGYSSRANPLLQAGNNPIFSDTFDARLEYVPGSFYVVDTSTPSRYLMPPSDVQVSGSSFSVDFGAAGWREFSGTYPTGSLVGTVANNWFASKDTFQVHYQMRVANQYLEVEQDSMVNTARITVHPGQCAFESTASVTYTPQLLSKTMSPVEAGSDRIDVEIIINADGQFVFSDGVNPAPNLITAQDRLVNLMLFTNTVQFYTQTLEGGVWNGVWTPAPSTSFNTREAWSANVVLPADVPAGFDSEVDFVVPNETPVMVRYQAHATLEPGVPGEIRNEIWIFGKNDGDGNPSYVIGNDGVGVGAGRQLFRVFKQDNVGNNLAGATFSLYATDLTAGYIPPGGLPVAQTITASDGTTLEFGLLPNEPAGPSELITDVNGMAVFDNQWINSSDEFLYLLVENTPPDGYVATYPNSFFTLSPKIDASTVADLGAMVNADVNQASDFVTVVNTPLGGGAGSLRVSKVFSGLSDATIQQYLKNFQIVITDPNLEEHVFYLADALTANGIVLKDFPGGFYTIAEKNAEVPGYTLETNPPLPIRSEIMPNYEGEVLIRIDNIYTKIPPPKGPDGPGTPGNPPNRGPITGDSVQMMSFVVLMFIAATVASGAIAGLERTRAKKYKGSKKIPGLQ